MAMTSAESILARASGSEKVEPGEYVSAVIDKAMCNEGFAAVFMNLGAAGVKRIQDPGRVIVIMDHYVPAPTERAATIHQLVRTGVEQLGITKFYDGRHGIAHQVMMEEGHVLPGELIVGTDSHTCTYGALGAASCGIGFSEMAYVLATGRLWFRIPETMRFLLSGALAPPLSSKDVMLKIAGDHSAEMAQYKSLEFSGEGAREMSVEARMTMSNMAVELGAKFCFFETDEKAEAWLAEKCGGGCEPLVFDKKAPVSSTYEMDLSALEPQVSLPHTVDNVKAISLLERTEVQQAILGSCTNGRLEDLRLAAGILAGRKVHPGVRLLVIPASWKVYRQAMEEGTLGTIIAAGGVILNPGCGPCFGAHGGLLGPGERCISSTNRNFKGRMGSDQAEVYLASPATVAVSAVAGYIADPRDM
ncbi:MAG: 3-isopropylmalate dehydratase large subunit [Actinomycetota bacterium]|nr:3-isopropylmalate dehydratase large subunit [Actinomycetota bacterium]MDD5668058.1 3-isopropylmalate dehydratase large subunit [Actinomycetota bacterium]